MKSHRQYIEEQIKKNPKFAKDLAEADQEVAIAVELAKLRELRGLSQTDVARLTGMRQPQIARLERGAYFPQFETLRKLLAALDGKLELSANLCRLTATHRRATSLRG